MTRLFNDPSLFMEHMLEGFIDAYSDAVAAVPGGVVRVDEPTAGKVAVVVGGGSGHYPAFAGLVGPGLADGAVVGNVFTSPSAEDAYNVAKAAEVGGGVIIASGNYAGDVLNFTAAVDRLAAEGLPARAMFVTDDVASAAPTEVDKRRGIAGDLLVFKVMGAAAEAGYDLEEVVRVGNEANDRTRTLGVAFAGCTLPGDSKPLFEVPEGKMGVGMGIHGEPGVREDDLPTAHELARVLVDGVLEELALDDGARVGAIVNGLGSTKYEELFVVWRSVASLLRDRGIVVVEPEVGELVTSLDMAGCSLTLVALNEELERLWTAPAYTPAFRKGALATSGDSQRRVLAGVERADEAVGEATEAARACGEQVLRILESMRAVLVAEQDELGRIDAIAGDGDHGRGMVRGVEAALDAARGAVANEAGVGSALTAAGRAWESKAGGTSGALWGVALLAIGGTLGDDRDSIGPGDVAGALQAGFDAIQQAGKANVGDKTMLDAYAPFLESFDEQLGRGVEWGNAWAVAANRAVEAAAASAELEPKVGRARPLAARSIGSPDAGATSLALCFVAASTVLGEESSTKG